jgi:hypothetical protein
VKVTVRDEGGEGATSLLKPDTLSVELRPGPPAALAVEGPATLECGTRAVLPQLRVRVCDAAGNHIVGESFEVRRRQDSGAVVPGAARRAVVVGQEAGGK